ncbi:hypothetical protein XELAEV_18043935mg [Xenopus laevis]|uniref:Uncharacterized protein n=1 Tax=Xenopus laevis TaxID=8355 RepID=A0A974BXX7_XENLA|nr:hypothetical protein XELAEV_18043935mg [Xenopus laevis]
MTLLLRSTAGMSFYKESESCNDQNIDLITAKNPFNQICPPTPTSLNSLYKATGMEASGSFPNCPPQLNEPAEQIDEANWSHSSSQQIREEGWCSLLCVGEGLRGVGGQ